MRSRSQLGHVTRDKARPPGADNSYIGGFLSRTITVDVVTQLGDGDRVYIGVILSNVGHSVEQQLAVSAVNQFHRTDNVGALAA